MIRRVKPFVYASVLGLTAVHCGGSSTPESTTPAQTTATESQPTEPGSTSAPMGSESAGGSMDTSESSSGGEWTSSERMPTAGTDEPGMGDDVTTPGATVLSDGQIAAIMDTVHSSEIEQAQLAQTKSTDPHVLSFASMMISHHSQARQQEQAMGLSTAASPMLQTLSSQGRQTMATLRDKSGKDFDRAYLQAQVEQHQKVLDTIDRQLMPSAKNPQLRSHLQSMRPTIEQHLKTARQAQEALNSSGKKPEAPHPTGSPR